MKKLTDFFIIGQPKSGTTALAEMLDQHPKIEISQPKEPSYFCTDFHNESDNFYRKPSTKIFSIRSDQDYEKVFSKNNYFIRGDASTNYLYSKSSAKNIYSHNPDCKIIAIFREPVSFLKSLHSQYLLDTSENEKNFLKALKLEPKRKEGIALSNRIKAPSYLFYNERIKYTEQLKRYLDFFSPNNVKLIIYDQFKSDNHATYQEITDFLGLGTSFTPTIKISNLAKKPKNTLVNKLIRNPSFSYIPKKILGPIKYDRLQLIIQAISTTSQKNNHLEAHTNTTLKQQYLKEVLEFNQYINDKNLTSSPINLVNLWGYKPYDKV